MKRYIIEEGTIDYVPQFEKDKKYIPEGLYPIRYWDVYEEDVPAKKPARSLRPVFDFEQEVKPEPVHTCADCHRPCKPQYRLCYRCHQFRLKKERIMKELSA